MKDYLNLSDIQILNKIVAEELEKKPASHDSRPASTEALAEGLWKEEE